MHLPLVGEEEHPVLPQLRIDAEDLGTCRSSLRKVTCSNRPVSKGQSRDGEKGSCRTFLHEMLEVLDPNRDDIEPIHPRQSRALERRQSRLVMPLLDQPRDVVRLVSQRRDDDVLRRDDVERVARRGGTQAVIPTLEPIVVAKADGVRRELLAVLGDDAQFGPTARLPPLLVAVLGRLVVERLFRHVREDEVRVVVGCDARDHAVDLEDGRDLDEELRRGEADAELAALPFALLDDGDLDEVGPGDEERVIVLPVKRALEEVRSGAVLCSTDVRDPLARSRVVDPDPLLTPQTC